MFDHFGRRLQRDLKGIVDERILSSETRSGSLMKVSPPPTSLSDCPDPDEAQCLVFRSRCQRYLAQEAKVKLFSLQFGA